MKTPQIDAATLGDMTRLARGLCAQPTITVETSRNAHFDPARTRIGLDVDTAMDPDRLRGTLTHECGHVRLSRYVLWPAPSGKPASLWFLVLNALEDPRVETWMQRGFPGTAPWFQALVEAETPSPLPPLSLVVQFVLGLASRETSSTDAPPSPPLYDSRVIAALARVWAARRRYIDAVPALGSNDTWPDGACEPEAPLEPECGPLDRTERNVRAWARAAWRIARDEIFPEALDLYELDADRIAAHAAGHPATDEALRSKSAARLTQAARDAFVSDLARSASAATRDEARHRRAMGALDAYLDERRRSDMPVPEPGLSPEGSPTAGTDPVPAGPHSGGAPPVPVKVTSQVGALSATLGRIILDRRQRTWCPGFRTGGRVDLQGAMRFAADPRDDRVWRRRVEDPSPLGSIGLLVDLSGSMSGGGKIEAAVAGTQLLAMAAVRAGIEFVIDGFQDQLIPIAALGHGLTAAVHARIEGMALEVRDRCPGGHNRARYNDDGPCLQEFAAKLRPRRGQRHLLLVISDGRPEGARSSADDLRRSVERLAARSDLTLIGLGLGASTDHVRDFYPAAIANVPVERLGAEIGAVLLRHCRLS